MSDITEFLLARLAEEEADALEVIWPYGVGATEMANVDWPDQAQWMSEEGWSSDEAPHLARWSPVRVLADVEGKRALLAGHDIGGCACGPAGDACLALRALAHPYADHPDFRGDWALVDVPATWRRP